MIDVDGDECRQSNVDDVGWWDHKEDADGKVIQVDSDDSIQSDVDDVGWWDDEHKLDADRKAKEVEGDDWLSVVVNDVDWWTVREEQAKVVDGVVDSVAVEEVPEIDFDWFSKLISFSKFWCRTSRGSESLNNDLCSVFCLRMSFLNLIWHFNPANLSFFTMVLVKNSVIWLFDIHSPPQFIYIFYYFSGCILSFICFFFYFSLSLFNNCSSFIQ